MQLVAQFNGSIPSIYDESLGPFLFGWSARELAGRVQAPAGGRVLEVACGTGISTQALRLALPSDVEIVATDLNEAMLEEAVERRGDLLNTTYQVADAQELPFEDDRFDAVVCQFGLMFLEEPVDALREAQRVLRPGGQLIFSTWGSLEDNPPVDLVQDIIRSFAPEDSPRFLETAFGMWHERVLRSIFAAAALYDITVDYVDHIVELPAAHGPAVGLVRGNPGAVEIEARISAPIDDVVAAAEAALAARFGSAPFRAPLQAVFVTGIVPAARRGS